MCTNQQTCEGYSKWLPARVVSGRDLCVAASHVDCGTSCIPSNTQRCLQWHRKCPPTNVARVCSSTAYLKETARTGSSQMQLTWGEGAISVHWPSTIYCKNWREYVLRWVAADISSNLTVLSRNVLWWYKQCNLFPRGIIRQVANISVSVVVLSAVGCASWRSYLVFFSPS